MEVADLALCDRRKRIDRVKPSVQLAMGIQMVRACLGEHFSVLDVSDGLHESVPLGYHIDVGVAEIVNVLGED